MSHLQTRTLSGLGQLSPVVCRVFEPQTREETVAFIRARADASCIARGLGNSYGDIAVNAGGVVVSTPRLNRVLGFDEETGELWCEAGLTIGRIMEEFLPRGFMPAVTPGTGLVTVGGAIANDVHGKNQHRDGNFGDHLKEIELLTAAGEVLRCTPDEHADVFWATVGGAGLTGIILTARMLLRRVETAHILAEYHPARNLHEALDAMEESDGVFAHSVAWIDCRATGKALGRSVLLQGNHAAVSDLPGTVTDPFTYTNPAKMSFPFLMPRFMMNKWAVRAFTSFLYAVNGRKPATLKDCERFFHPLDAIGHWDRIYGRSGFVLYQALFPLQARDGLVELMEKLSKSGRASFLSILKRFGRESPGHMSFPRQGYLLGVDIPYRRGVEEFVHECDKILLRHGGRLYLAKDALARPETIRAMYPRIGEFRAVKRQIDPDSRFISRMAQRLRLLED